MEEYVPINIHTIKNFDQFDLYIKHSSEKESMFVLYKKRESSIAKSSKIFDKPNILYIKKKQSKEYMQYLEKNLKAILLENKDKPELQSKIIYNVMENVIDDLFTDSRNTAKLEKVKYVVDTVIEETINTNISLYLVNLTIYDYFKYTHSVNSFVFSICFSKYLKKYEDSQLKIIGVGALVHDIGETQLEPKLIKLDRKFTQEERKIIEEHPYLGYHILQGVSSIDPKAKFMVLQHHERWDGSGYPRKLKGEQITEYTRLLSLVDVYGAMTTKRPFREAYSPFCALKSMVESKQFNKYELNSFVSFLENSNNRYNGYGNTVGQLI